MKSIKVKILGPSALNDQKTSSFRRFQG